MDEMLERDRARAAWDSLLNYGAIGAILLILLGQQIGWVPSRMQDSVEAARAMATANFQILVDRNHIFEQMLFMDIQNCIHTSHNTTEEDLCMDVARDGFSQIEQIRNKVDQLRKEMKGK